MKAPRPLRVLREVCRDYEASSRLEWLETNGTGGFAMGTAAGVNTRRYHGLLVAALRPPTDRFVLLSKLEETVRVDRVERELATTQYPGVLDPQGFRWLEGFRLDPFPTWTWAFDGAVIEKQLFLLHGKQTAVVQIRANRPCHLRVRPFLAYRDFHALAHANDSLDGRFTESRRSADASMLRVVPYAGLPALGLHHNGTASAGGAAWYHQTEYLAELERGLDYREDLYCIGTLDFALSPERSAWIVATIEGDDAWAGVRVASEEAIERERRSGAGAISTVGPTNVTVHTSSRASSLEPFAARLDAAADAFRVRRADGTPTLIAGYPWFADWGRDTMIALPGLLLARGLLDEAREVLTGFLDHLDGGLVPNRFADSGQPPEYNTVDGTLWMFQAVSAYLGAGGDRRWAHEVFYPRAQEIILAHERGTHHGIGVDPADGLLVGGGPGTQLTWMDAKIGDRVITPRHGKAVEVNALWFNALRVMEALALERTDAAAIGRFARAAQRARDSFRRLFWNEDRGCLFDVLLPGGPDGRMRPNQIFAVSLPYRMLPAAQEQRVVLAVEEHLLTPVGLRTLAPGEEGYRPRYEGDPASRDSAYHQGTVWPWLLGPFVTAYLNAFGRDRDRLAHVASLLGGLEANSLVGGLGDLGAAPGAREGVLGQIGEVFDGDPPHRPGGAPAQAWSVGEILRVLRTELRDEGDFPPGGGA
jgi:predicted glycogen debranching enzyme